MRRRFGIVAALTLALAVTPAAAAQAGVTGVGGVTGVSGVPAVGPDDHGERQLKAAAQAEGDAAATPGRDGAAQLEVPAPASSPEADPKGLEDCAKKRPTSGKKYTVCIGPGRTHPKIAAGSPARVNGKAAAAAAVEVLPLPQFCIDNAFRGWFWYRTQACSIASRTATIYDQDGGVAGTIEYLELNFSYTSSSIATWAQQIELRKFGGTGVGLLPGTTAEGFAVCANACVTPISTFPPQPLVDNADAAGQAFFDTVVSVPGDKAFSFTTFTYSFTNPAWVPVSPGTVSPPRVRCDNALPGSAQVGCVFPDYVPVEQYARNGSFPELARHIGEAQASGLPGAYPDGPTLNRLTDSGKVGNNRDRACPRSDRGGYPRPETKSCDEYPFASSTQGAETATPKGPARTFDWCQINEPIGTTGPVGYSVCMIDAVQNSSGGSDLGTFYRTERVIDGDPFYVWITGSGGGPNPNPPNYPPVVSAGPDVSGDEGFDVELNGSATDDDGPPQVHWSYQPGPDVDPGAHCSFGNDASAVTTLRCNDDGTYTVTISGSDGIHDEASTDSAIVHLANVPPQLRRLRLAAQKAADQPALGIVSPQPWQLFRVGDRVTLTTNFEDPGTNDTQTCNIQWDDGTSSSGTVAGSACGGTHVYTHAGMYTIQPGITDDDGGVSEKASVMVVVYDPYGGWANTDGSYDSPAGALTSSPNTTGEGWFHLAGRYYPQNDLLRPQGSARSWIPGTDYRFDTDGSTLDWLVVTPDGKVAAKGSGTLAGHSGRYGFVFYGYDGCTTGGTAGACQPGTDKFRAVVWPLSAGANPGAGTVYDNRPSAGYDVDVAEPTTLRTGQVLIQRP
ncbi:PKD domain-containing protein [Actinoplanes sp. NPDC026623]|uniref:NucA/NucB deoxyribonuclease domain-containing protein n=1 Tax=Actinoplanes sp. NPDC026623 TaxID=3155610 RepID=UPI0033F08B07